MNRLKFISNDAHQKEFGIAVRKNVYDYFKENDISTKGDVRMYFKAIIMLLLYIIPFIVILTTTMNLWWALSLVLLMGIGEAGIGMSVMHDAAHGAFSKKQWVNKFFSSTMFLLGSNTFNWNIQHNILHHTFTNIYGFDQDIETKAVIRLCSHAPLKKYHRFQHFYAFFLYGLMTIARLVTDFKQLINFSKEGITQAHGRNPKLEIIKLIISKALYLSVIIGLPLLLTDFTWWQILAGFIIMHFTAGIIMSIVFQMAHVVEGADQPLPNTLGNIEENWVLHELNTTSNYARNNGFLNWYAGGLNFQIEHHLFTNICHIHYSKISPIVEQTVRDFGFTYNVKPSFTSALISHFQRLKELGISKKDTITD